MNLLLLKRDPDAWRVQQSSKKEAPTPSTSSQARPIPVSTPKKLSEQHSTVTSPKHSSKRKRKAGDDIDKLFDSALGKKQKRSALPQVLGEPNVLPCSDAPELEGILGAIKAAPKVDKDGKHKKKKVR